MQKSVGLSRTVRIDWLDAVASMCLENQAPTQIRKQLNELLESAQPGPVERQRIIDTLIRIWVRAEPDLKTQGLDIFRQLSTRQERLWLHYGMILAQYPFFRICAAIIGQISRSEEFIRKPSIKNKVAAEMGNLGSIDRAIERLFKTLMDWEVLIPTADKKQFKTQLRMISTTNKDLEIWLLYCALRSHPSDMIPFEDLKYLPELFPFRFSITIDDMRKNPLFEIHRQGGGLDMVRGK